MPSCCCGRPGSGARTSAHECLPWSLHGPASLQELHRKASRTPAESLKSQHAMHMGGWLHNQKFALCRILEDAVRSLILTNGITVVVASGNNDVDACTVAPACVQVSASAQL